jgi:O-antigen ligase
MAFYICAFLIAASLVLGGGTRGGFFSDVILQIVAVPSLLVALWKIGETPLAKMTKAAFAFCLALVAVALIQLIPLPPWLWAALPSRAAAATTFALINHPFGWMPISVTPNATWMSLLSLLPPLTIFICMALLDWRQRRAMSFVIIAGGVISVFLGLLQVAQGPNSSLRFFEFTNPTEAVGFFANRNHFAALLYTALLFATAWLINVAASSRLTLKQMDRSSTLLLVAGFVVIVVLLSGQAMARSRAGLGLTIVALVGAVALAGSDRRSTSGVTPAKMLLGAVALVMIFSAQYALFRILERFGTDPLEDARLTFAQNTLIGAKAYMPFGSGLGSFVSVYGLFEKPQDTLANVYANHAHNDFLELWLETGVLGLALAGIFVVWFVLRCAKIWRKGPGPGSLDIDRLLARAATIVIALLLAHSFVDYPLRTSAILAIMAFSCGLLLDPPVITAQAEVTARARSDAEEIEALLRERSPSKARHSSPRPAAASSPVTHDGRLAGQRFGSDIDWPAEWRRPASSAEQGAKPTSAPPNRSAIDRAER